LFLAFDTDGSGGIDEKEFMKALGHKQTVIQVILVISCSPSDLFDAGFIAGRFFLLSQLVSCLNLLST